MLELSVGLIAGGALAALAVVSFIVPKTEDVPKMTKTPGGTYTNGKAHQ